MNDFLAKPIINRSSKRTSRDDDHETERKGDHDKAVAKPVEIDNGPVARLEGQLERVLGLVEIVEQNRLAVHRNRHDVFAPRVVRVAAESELGRFRFHLDLAERGA
jgi:hypothetical protein